jgi:predicted RNA-binding Zn-ribbon protein involved in translation (DUF1610 family)
LGTNIASTRRLQAEYYPNYKKIAHQLAAGVKRKDLFFPADRAGSPKEEDCGLRVFWLRDASRSDPKRSLRVGHDPRNPLGGWVMVSYERRIIKMAKFFTLTCPSCGGSLKITNEVNRFACAHCGNEHIVEKGDGIISLGPVVEGFSKIEKGLDKTTSELAIPRLKEEISNLKRETASQVKSKIKSLDTNAFGKLPGKVLALKVYLSLRKSGKMAYVSHLSISDEVDQFSIKELEEMYTYFGGDSDSVNHKTLFHSRSEIKTAWAELREILSPISDSRNPEIKKKMEQLAHHINIVNH